MIVQQINLYQDRFKPKKLILSAFQMAVITGLLSFALLTGSFWFEDQMDRTERQNQHLLAQKQQQTQTLDQLRKKLETLLADNRIDQQITDVSRNITVLKHMIDYVENNQFGSGKGFSENLQALSGFHIADVWLNEISLSENDMTLSGSALRAENVPEYFTQFRKRDLFAGRMFDVFELDRKKERDWKVDFIIASRAVVDE